MQPRIDILKRTQALVDSHFEEWRELWLDLLGDREHSYFFSWPWLELWLSSLPLDVDLDLVRIEWGDAKAACFLGHNQQTRHRVIKSNAYFLHYTGDETYDNLTLEYNQIPALNPEPDLLRALLNNLPHNWDEFYLPALDCRLFPADCMERLAGDYDCLKQKEVTAYYVDLADMNQDPESFIVRLSAKTRRNIRRDMRKFSQEGTLELQVADDRKTAFEIFNHLVELHQAYWRKRGFPGAFGDEWFRSFHEELIERRLQSGEIQLVRIWCGNQTVGCIYNFVHRGIVYHYQNGFNYERFNRSPGIISLAMCIPYNAAQGHRIFDFMAGESEYKKNLSTNSKAMVWYLIQKKRMSFAVEKMLKEVKGKLHK